MGSLSANCPEQTGPRQLRRRLASRLEPLMRALNSPATAPGAAADGCAEPRETTRAHQRQLHRIEEQVHALRTPLTVLKANLEVLRRTPGLEAQVQALLMAELSADAELLAARFEQLLALTAGAARAEPDR